MNEEQRRKLIDLHFAAMQAQVNHAYGDILHNERDTAEQAFLDFVYSLGLDGAK